MKIELKTLPPSIEAIHCDLLAQQGISLRVLRLDQIHSTINGNKWFKLKKNLINAQAAGLNTIVSFGGAYSNHLRALAAAGNHFGFKTIGVVRGEIVQPLNPVLAFATSQGMELIGISRSEYRRKNHPAVIKQLKSQFGDFYLIPEGGSNASGVGGCADIVSWLHWQCDDSPKIVATACGTGATMAGIIRGLQESNHVDVDVLGMAVLKGADFLNDQIRTWLPIGAAQTEVNWKVYTEFHGGGYAKCSPELRQFLQWFAGQTSIPVEPVYTGKLFHGIFSLIRAKALPENCQILALHCGGL